MYENISSSLEHENEEQNLVKAKTMSRDDFSDLLYGDSSTEISDRRFRREGSFKYFNPDDLTDIANRASYFSTISVEDKIVGVCKLEKVPGEEKSYWISFVSIDQDYQGRGYSRKLLEEVFQFSRDNGLNLITSSYSDDGYEKIKKVMGELSKETGVSFEDTDKKI